MTSLRQPLHIVIALVLLAGCGNAPKVETIHPRKGAIRESFVEPGRTRLERTWRIVMPIDARIARIALEPGDHVTSGQMLADIDMEPLKMELAEARAAVGELQAQLRVNAYDALENAALIESRAFVAATTESLKAADAQVDAERARSERAAKELQRVQALADKQNVSQQELDDVALNAETTLIEYRRQQFIRTALNALSIAANLGPEYIDKWLGRKSLQREGITHQLAQAQQRLARAEYNLALADLRSPIDGVVLERYERGGGPFPSGHALLLLGNLDELDAIADVLTQDAMRLKPGTAVELESDPRVPAIQGAVKRIEPAGFTKLSSLGVEQQRVNVIVGFSQPVAGIGVGYRLNARFFTASKDGALLIPRFSVLQAPDQSHYVFCVRNGTLQRRTVKIGIRSDLEMEVLGGGTESDELVAAPDADMKDGQRVSAQ